MTQTDNSAVGRQGLSTAARLAWIVLILVTLYICYFQNLGVIGLVGPDEPRYAWIARDMAETGDWVTPRLYGKPWFEKPVLYYWGAAISFKLFGVGDATARLPSAISALFATLAMAWLALRVYGVETARWLLLLLPTTVGMIGFSHAAATDMPFAAMLTMAMVFAARLLGLVSKFPNSFTSSVPFTSFFFGFFLGLAVLAKGPAAIILFGGSVLLWAAFTKQWSAAFRCLHPIAIASFCLAAFPWYILCSHRNPDFLRIFIIEHNFKRYLTPEFQHMQPFWFYIPVLLIAFLPWTLAMLCSVFLAVLRYMRPQRPSPTTILLLCWSFFFLVFFSISQSKLPGYVLPIVPAIGLLVARTLVYLMPYKDKFFRRLQASLSILSVLEGLLLVPMGTKFHTSRITGQAMTSIGWVLLLIGLANLLLVLKRRVANPRLGAEALCVIPILVLLLFFPQLSAPWLSYDPSGRTLARELQEKQVSLDGLYLAEMPRGQEYSLDFYTHRQLESWDIAEPKTGRLLLRTTACGLYVKPPWTCVHDPLELPQSGWFVFNVVPENSVDGLSGFGGRNRRDSADGQPR